MLYEVCIRCMDRLLNRRWYTTVEAVYRDLAARGVRSSDLPTVSTLADGRHQSTTVYKNGLYHGTVVVMAIDTTAPASNDFETVQDFATRLMARFRMVGWRFAWNRRKTACGICDHGKSQIQLSNHYVANNSPEDIRLTILHEIAHAIVGPGHGHDLTWQVTVEAIGGKGSRCNERAVMPNGKVEARCDCPELVHRMHRMPKAGKWSCRRCQRKLEWSVSA